MSAFFKKEDIDKAMISNMVQELDGKKVVLRCLEVDGVSLLCGVDENGHIYVLRMDEIREVNGGRPKESYMEWDMRQGK